MRVAKPTLSVKFEVNGVDLIVDLEVEFGMLIELKKNRRIPITVNVKFIEEEISYSVLNKTLREERLDEALAQSLLGG